MLWVFKTRVPGKHESILGPLDVLTNLGFIGHWVGPISYRPLIPSNVLHPVQNMLNVTNGKEIRPQASKTLGFAFLESDYQRNFSSSHITPRVFVRVQNRGHRVHLNQLVLLPMRPGQTADNPLSSLG